MPERVDASCESVSHFESVSNEDPWLDPKPLSTWMSDKESKCAADNDFVKELSFLSEHEDLLFLLYFRDRGGKKLFLTCK